MARLKLLKTPKAPKLPKRPKLTASVTAKENWLKRVAQLEKDYKAKCSEVNKENAKRKSNVGKGATLSKKIASIGAIGSRK